MTTKIQMTEMMQIAVKYFEDLGSKISTAINETEDDDHLYEYLAMIEELECKANNLIREIHSDELEQFLFDDLVDSYRLVCREQGDVSCM
mmetsp:Transcript_16712/g.48396  ORF Transcript_16712/g.48396 Transcript_16712/m.48396 type:complete len:90 (+) Transcript_16712:54-323(+)